MAKILGSEGKLGVRLGSVWGTPITCGVGRGMCFESLEYNDNPTYLEFNSKGCGKSMKNAIIRGFTAPTLSITYHLKYGGNQMRLLAGLLGSSATATETTAGQGDYLHYYFYNTQRKFFTIAVQSTSNTSMEWASCYPVSATIQYEMYQPVTVVMNFVTTPRNNTPITNTFAVLNSASDPTDSLGIDYIVAGQNPTLDYFLMDEADGTSWATKRNWQSITYQIDRPMEHIAESYATTRPEPLSTSLMTSTIQVNLTGLDDHTYLDYQALNKEWQSDLRILGAQIGTGQRQTFHISTGRMKYNADISTSISSDGINSATMTFESLYQNNLSLTDAPYKDVSIKGFFKDTTAYF